MRNSSRYLIVAGGLALIACDSGGVDGETPTTAFGFPGRPPVAVGGSGGSATCESQPILGGAPPLSPQFAAPVVEADVPPPPISGGTLFATADGAKLVAADPDRDAIYLIDVASRSLERKLTLNAGDEPGRITQDGAGRIHVALRGGRSILTFGLASAATPRRSEVCDLPRGIGYDAKRDRVYVACAEGTLVSIDPATGAARMKLEIGRDLRDVIVREDGLYVSSFRSAELVRLDPDAGTITETRRQPNNSHAALVTTCSSGAPVSAKQLVESSSDVAWRSIDLPTRGVAMLHQRAQNSEVQISAGGYGSSAGCGSGIVQSAITVSAAADSGSAATVDLSSSGLFVDMAVDPTGSRLAIANPSGWGADDSVQLFEVPAADNGIAATAPGRCIGAQRMVAAEGQVTAVAFVSSTLLVAQTREPAGIAFYDLPNNGPLGGPTTLDLHEPSRADSGHTMFHITAGAGIACASCHPEAGDDSHVWTFAGIGARRTQNLRGGILGTEPFHWNGDMHDFPMLVDEVFVKRMNGPMPDAGRSSLLARWIDKQPALRATSQDALAVERGKALFESEELGCTTCHAGAHLTNNESKFVGTGAVLQVPSLLGVSFRAPFMHDGCAQTLADRFGSCGGGDQHGHTAQLTADQTYDVTTYLESL